MEETTGRRMTPEEKAARVKGYLLRKLIADAALCRVCKKDTTRFGGWGQTVEGQKVCPHCGGTPNY